MAYLLTAFSPSIYVMYFTYSLVGGKQNKRLSCNHVDQSIGLSVYLVNSTTVQFYIWRQYDTFNYDTNYISMTGLGSGLIYFPIVKVVQEYFDKKRGKAMGLAAFGAAAGTFVMPLLMSNLFR